MIIVILEVLVREFQSYYTSLYVDFRHGINEYFFIWKYLTFYKNGMRTRVPKPKFSN